MIIAELIAAVFDIWSSVGNSYVMEYSYAYRDVLNYVFLFVHYQYGVFVCMVYDHASGAEAADREAVAGSVSVAGDCGRFSASGAESRFALGVLLRCAADLFHG